MHSEQKVNELGFDQDQQQHPLHRTAQNPRSHPSTAVARALASPCTPASLFCISPCLSDHNLDTPEIEKFKMQISFLKKKKGLKI